MCGLEGCNRVRGSDNLPRATIFLILSTEFSRGDTNKGKLFSTGSKMVTCKILLVVAMVTITTLLTSPSFADDNKPSRPAGDPKGVARFRILSLLDWKAYMNFFDKRYSSLSQQLVRHKIFLARVMEVFLTGAKYRLFKLSYYTAINKWSDATPLESKQLMSGDSYQEENEGLTDDESAREILRESLRIQGTSPDQFEADLERERSEAFGVSKKARNKRDVTTGERELSVADLISARDSQVDSRLKIKWTVRSDNPDYVPVQSAVDVDDDSSMMKDIPKNELDTLESSKEFSQTSPAAVLKTAFNEAINWWSADRKDLGQKRNTIVIRDWRKDGCISPPRDQGYCASCYAISSMAFVEWALCTNQGNILTPLSVQYMVSCGSQYMEETNGSVRLEGCRHGMSRQTMDFVREYGVELEVNMPYLERETVCPVEENASKKMKGYIRPNVRPPLRLSGSTTQLDLALKTGPVIVSMREPRNFLAYGGGLVEHCDPIGGHAMLVVGNMIEDGVEYLLIKNSFGPYWGYEGYFKFRRSAMKECVKEFIVPMVSFPGRKAQNRRIKAYLANQQSSFSDSDVDDEDDVTSGASELLGSVS